MYITYHNKLNEPPQVDGWQAEDLLSVAQRVIQPVQELEHVLNQLPTLLGSGSCIVQNIAAFRARQGSSEQRNSTYGLWCC